MQAPHLMTVVFSLLHVCCWFQIYFMQPFLNISYLYGKYGKRLFFIENVKNSYPGIHWLDCFFINLNDHCSIKAETQVELGLLGSPHSAYNRLPFLSACLMLMIWHIVCWHKELYNNFIFSCVNFFDIGCSFTQFILPKIIFLLMF